MRSPGITFQAQKFPSSVGCDAYLTYVFTGYFVPHPWTLHGGHVQERRAKSMAVLRSTGSHVSKARRTRVRSSRSNRRRSAESLCRATRRTRMSGGNKAQQHLPTFREIVADVANNWLVPASWMPDNIVFRGASDEANNDVTLQAKSMLSKKGVQMAIGPPRLGRGSQPEILAFEFPFSPDGVLRTITVRLPEWEAHGVIYIYISLPTARDDDPNIVCYNGSLMQTVKIGEYPQVLYTEPLPGDAKMHEVLLNAFTVMSNQFSGYVTSLSFPSGY